MADRGSQLRVWAAVSELVYDASSECRPSDRFARENAWHIVLAASEGYVIELSQAAGPTDKD